MARRSKLVMLGLIPLGALALTSGSHAGAAGTLVHHPRAPLARVGNYGWSASNWSGYAISGSTGAYHAITGQWTVTSVAATSRATYSSSWIGIDGFNNSNLIQTGTEADYYSGSAHYDAWWEILPAAETVIPSITVRPGDHMSASITKGSGSTWTITIEDTSNGESFTTNQSYSGPQTSAEWIQEAPEVNGRIAKLAHYGQITFDPGTVNGANPGLTAADSGIMVQNGVQVSTPSNPDSDTDGFNAKYGSSQPSPPSS
jgi:Peptidase A4 family